MPEKNPVRLATAQVVVRDDPCDSGQLRQSGGEARALMRQARQAGARIIHFPEGTTCSPHRRIVSATGPEEVGPADWERARWPVLREELAEIARLAAELRLWTVLGAMHPLTPPNRPHNSMYVISDQGRALTRSDERLLSNTKLSLMYSPGSAPVTFDVDGVLFSTAGPSRPQSAAAFAAEAQGHAAANSLWVSFAISAQNSADAPSGIISPDGRWAARCSDDGQPAMAIADIDSQPEPIAIAISAARPWRRKARTGIYDTHWSRRPRRGPDRLLARAVRLAPASTDTGRAAGRSRRRGGAPPG
ncbi:MAG TPA: carbon-nitrogen hydrolase family protein [Trebonia sp.]